MTAAQSKRSLAKATHGIRLQDLPLEVLQTISRRLSAVEWARGPAQTCRLLSDMHLPRIALDPLERVPYPAGHGLEANGKAKARLTNRIFAALKWTAQRMGPCTTSLNMEYQHLESLPSSRAENPVIAAFRSASGLSTLKCLRLVMFEINHAAVATFSDWLLEQTTSLVALHLLAPSWQLGAGTLTFQHLRYVSLAAYGITGSCFRPAEIMPVLEVLGIVGKAHFEIDLTGCKHLRCVNIRGTFHHNKPLELHSCQLSIDMTLGWTGQLATQHPSSPQMVSALRSAAQIGLYCTDFLVSEAAPGFFSGCQSLEVFTLEWAARTNITTMQGPPLHTFHHLLMNCMPAQGQPLWNLKTIIIRTERDYYMSAKIPAMLPRLEELVMYTMGPLTVYFEDPIATSTSLRTLHLSGRNLHISGEDVLRMSCALHKRGLTLSAVCAPKDCSGERFERRTSCIYLRPVSTEDLSLRLLHGITEKLALQCRCGACFSCLRRAGAVDACVARPPDPLH